MLLRKSCCSCACYETNCVREEEAVPSLECLARRLCNAAERRKERSSSSNKQMASYYTAMRMLENQPASCSDLAPNQRAPQASCSVCSQGRQRCLRWIAIHAVLQRRLSIPPGLDWARREPIKVGVAGVGCTQSRRWMRLEIRAPVRAMRVRAVSGL